MFSTHSLLEHRAVCPFIDGHFHVDAVEPVQPVLALRPSPALPPQDANACSCKGSAVATRMVKREPWPGCEWTETS